MMHTCIKIACTSIYVLIDQLKIDLRDRYQPVYRNRLQKLHIGRALADTDKVAYIFTFLLWKVQSLQFKEQLRLRKAKMKLVKMMFHRFYKLHFEVCCASFTTCLWLLMDLKPSLKIHTASNIIRAGRSRACQAKWNYLQIYLHLQLWQLTIEKVLLLFLKYIALCMYYTTYNVHPLLHFC